LYEFGEYLPPHLFTNSNIEIELTPSVFAIISSTSLKLIV
jgi:hypothetical protein